MVPSLYPTYNPLLPHARCISADPTTPRYGVRVRLDCKVNSGGDGVQVVGGVYVHELAGEQPPAPINVHEAVPVFL